MLFIRYTYILECLVIGHPVNSPLKYDKNGKRKTVNKKTCTKYCGDMPMKYLKLCELGGSTPEFLLQEMIGRTTFDEWCDKYPDMAQAKRIGKQIAEGWWIKQAKNHLITYSSKEEGSTHFDTNLYKFIMGGRFGHNHDKKVLDMINELKQAMLSQKPQTGSAKAEEGEYTIDTETK